MKQPDPKFPRRVNYEQLEAGGDGWSRWVLPRHDGYKLVCCDCGLTHVYQYRVRNGKVEWRTRLDKRATAGIRRGKEQREKIRGLRTAARP